jgi:hypothetical protein
MRRIRRTIFGVLASVSLLGGAGGVALAAITVAPTGVVALAPHPTAVEYGATAIEY